MIKLIMLSGGSESTGLLFRELSAEAEGVLFHVHHVRLINRERRAAAEDRAVVAIVREARRVRDFVFTANTIEWPDMAGAGYVGWDVWTLGYAAGYVARQLQEAVLGHSGYIEEVEAQLGISKTERGGAEAWSADFRPLGAQLAFAAHFVDRKPGEIKAELVYPLIETETHEIRRHIPKKLMGRLVSCRRPIYVGREFLGCGLCYTCVKMRHVTEAENRGGDAAPTGNG